MVKIRIDGTTADFEKKLNDLGAIGEKALTGLKVAAAATGAALVAIGTSAFKVGSEYESAFAGVEKTVDASAKELEVMRQALIDMSGEIPLTAAELAGIAEAAGQLGISTADITSFTKVMANLGVATNMTAEEAATMLARFANVTRLDPSLYENLGSAVVALGNNFATTEADIVSMSQRMAGAATNAGFTEAEILGLAAALSSVGVEAQAGGGAMTRVLNQIDKEVKSSGENLEAFAAIAGMSAEEFSAAWGQNAAHAFDLFVQGLGEVQEAGGSVAATLESVGISETIATTALTNLAGAGGLLTSALDTANTAFEENTALATEAATRYKTMESQMQLLKNGAAAVGISMYDSFRGAAMDAVQGLQTSVTKLNVEISKPAIRQALENIGTAFASLVKTVGNMVTSVLPPFIRVLGFVADNMDAILPVTLGLVAAFKLFSILNTVSSAFEVLQTTAAAASAQLMANNSLTLANVSTQAMMSAALAKSTTAELVRTAAGKVGMTIDATGNLITAQGTVATLAQTSAVLASSGAIGAKTVAVGVLTGYVSLTTAAQWLWNAAMAANPVGLVVAGVVVLVGVLAGLTIAFQKNNEELQAATDQAKELKAEQENMADSVRDSAAAFESNKDSINTNAEVASRLVAKIRDISASNDGAAVKSVRLRAAVDQLNQVMPELGVSFNETTGQVEGLTDATDDYIASVKEAAKAEAYRERAIELSKEQVNAELELAKVKAQMREMEEAGLATFEQYSQASGEYYTRSTEGYAILEAATQGYDEIIKQATDDLGFLEEAMIFSNEASRESADAFKYSEENLQSLADQYGTTVEAIRAATDGTVESMDAWVAAQDEAAAASIEAVAAMAEETAGHFETISNGFDTLTQKQAISLAEYEANMLANMEATANWGANMDTLMAYGVNEGILSHLLSLGEEGALQAQAWVNELNAMNAGSDIALGQMNEATATRLGELNGVMVDGLTVAQQNAEAVLRSEAYIAAGAAAPENIAAGIQGAAGLVVDAASNTGTAAMDATNAAIEGADPVGVGQTMVDDISSGVTNAAPDFVSNTEDTATEAVEAAKEAASADVTQPIGVDLVTGVVNGVEEMQSTLVSAAEAAVTEAVSAARSAGGAGVTHSIGADMMSGITNGINAGASGVVNAMVSAVQQAIAAAKAAAQIASPSKVMRREVGEMLGEGLALGIGDSTQDAVDAAKDQMQDVLDAYGGDTGLTLQARFLAEFGDVPDKFFETGQTAGEQFIAGFNLAAIGFMATLENFILGRPLMSVGADEDTSSGVRDVTVNINQPAESPDATGRAVRHVFEYGLAGERN